MISADVIIIGAGAAGLMCAIEAGKRGKKTIILDHSAKIAEKIRISGGGRCNFTNLHCAPDKYVSNNKRFCTSALTRYTQHDFMAMVDRHGIAWHEKTLGQLFCDHSAEDIIQMLLKECADVGVTISLTTNIEKIVKEDIFVISTDKGVYNGKSLVVACGGLSVPKIGASPLGYKIAEQFGLNVIAPRAGLVPLTFDPALLSYTKELSGLSVDPSTVGSEDGTSFREGMLFTHRGLSGPSILQISSYWQQGEEIIVNLSPDLDVLNWLKEQRTSQAKAMAHTVLGEILPKRLAQTIVDELKIEGRMGDLSDKILKPLSERITAWRVKPSGSEGYRTAEVTLGGVDTQELSSKTLESRKVTGLYFIGEVVDVTGHLGGYNFQWAWSSGWCAGQFV